MGKDAKNKLIRDHHKVSSKKPGKNSETAEAKEKPTKPENSSKKEKPDKKQKREAEIPEKPQQTKPKKAKTLNSHEDEENPVEVLKKPGQKHPEPSLDDPTRAFYETLYEQNPDSPMAQKYCLDYGLLPEETATSLLSRLKHKNK